MTYEEKPFDVTYTDEATKSEVKLSCILSKNPNNPNTILLCHGMFGDKNSEINEILLKGLIPFYSILRFDFEGSGESSGEWDYADYNREISNLSNLVKIVNEKYKINIFCIIGHSKAGADVMIAASKKNLIENKNCLFISLGGRLTFGKPEKRFTENELLKIKNDGFILWEHKGKKWKITQKAIDERKNMNPLNDVKNIDKDRATKILHVHGLKDTSTPVEEAEVIRKAIPGSEIKYIEGANHFFVGKEKELVDAIAEWLKEKVK